MSTRISEGQESLPLKSSAFLRSCGVKTTDGSPAPFDLAGAIRLALARSNLTIKVACAHMAIDQGLFSRQLSGDGHISFPRLLLLPREFWNEFYPLLGEALGYVVTEGHGIEQSMSRALHALGDVVGKMRLATSCGCQRKAG